MLDLNLIKIAMKKYLFISLFSVLLFSLFFTTQSAEAKNQKLKSIIQDSFNKYTIGSIVGQGRWFDRENGSTYVVQNLVVKEGRKALYNNSNDSLESIITKTSRTALANGKQSFWVRTENRSGWSDFRSGQNVQMGVYQGSWDGPARAVFTFMKDGHVTYIDSSGYVPFDTYNDNAWNLAEIEWRTIDKSARFRVNHGVWTSWIPFTGGPSFTGFDTVGLGSVLLGTGGVYIDTLQ